MRGASAGRVLGVPGAGLENAGWAANPDVARIGRAGELRTATVLDSLAARSGGPTVFHDLRIPVPGIRSNIDHAVVSGRTITLIDAKVWAGGFYWTIGGRTYRGFSRFAAADSRNMPMAVEAIGRYLASHRVDGRLARPMLVVWPPSQHSRPSSLWALNAHGSKVMTGAAFTARAGRVAGTRPADPRLVAVLAQLVTRHRGPRVPAQGQAGSPLDF